MRRLIRELAEVEPGASALLEDEANLHYVARLEEAHTASRYIPYSYEEKEVRNLYGFVIEKLNH
ncbi:MAG: hypothetical protein QW418_02445 [Candidatus Korarchaeum sp.]